MFTNYCSKIKPMEVVSFILFVFMFTPGFPGVAFTLSGAIAQVKGLEISTFVLSFITWTLSFWVGFRARRLADRFARIKEFNWRVWRHVTEMQDMNRMEFASVLLFFIGDLLFLSIWPFVEKAF